MINALNYFLHKKLIFLLVLGLIQLAMHWPVMTQMPGSVHAWRQCNTLSLSRNFYDESMDIRYSRVDERLDTDGITGSPFPAYEWTLAVVYKVFGFNHFYHRWFSFFIFVFCAWGMYGLLEIFFKSRYLAALGTWAFSFMPEYFYHQVNALPDILALALLVCGLYLHLKNKNNRKIFSWILLGLAALVKIQFFVGVCFVLIYDGIKVKDKTKSSVSFIHSIAVSIICFSLVLLWYSHANKMMHVNDLFEYTLDFSWPQSLSILSKNTISFIISSFPEMLIGYAFFPFLIVGSYRYIANFKGVKSFKIPMLMYGFCLLLWFILMNNKIAIHQYYLLVSLPFFVLVGTNGIKYLSDKSAILVALFILILTPILTFSRIYPSRWANGKSGIPLALLNNENRIKLSNSIPDDAKCLVGPDPSTTIYFYYLHKKGFCLPDCENFSKIENGRGSYTRNYILRGAQYLIVEDKCLSNDSIKYYIKDTIVKAGGFGVYKIGIK